MIINVKTHPNSSQEKIVLSPEGDYEVWLKEKAIDGKANLKLVKLLKEHFGNNVRIKSGESSRRKIIELSE